MSGIDLNLVRTFVVLYEARSVTLAAEQLFVTQPSVSYALSRLRDLLNDRLFVRTKEGMEPTAVATQLYQVLRQSLTQIENTIDSARSFEALISEKRFTVAMTDLGEMALLPHIFRELQLQAPNVELEVVPLEIDKAYEWMVTGKVDAVICSRPIAGSDIERRVILEERYVCVMNAQSAPQGDELTMQQFLERKHAVVSRSLGHGLAEEVMAELGVRRKVSLVLPHFSVLPSVLRETDLLAIVPGKIAQAFSAMAPLKICPLPFQVPGVEVALYWLARNEHSHSQRWFRERVIAAVAQPDSITG
ncbi:LysR family transcriptional regulator [Marinobacterium zhoushanense]|uniref:LysR family transcriptional regulator n=1 Tax=Marinobacterium zhoushanense TaxID=1679163 RepID=UPI0016670FC8|nr:LysR family transcriptional regulator [Marinobacterium zhoushanense]